MSRCPLLLRLAFLLLASGGLFSSLAQSTRPGWGSVPYHDASGTGVTFRVWAPNATAVHAPGQFNSWSTSGSPLVKELTNGVWTGVWSADVAGAVAGQQYKYYLTYNGSSIWKQDPRARLVQYSGSGGNSIIYDPTAFNWTNDAPVAPGLNDLVIYELHIGTFYTNANTGSKFLSATNRLDYLKQLGVSAVEVMPIAEFPGNVSWGYNPAQIFAVENQGYGGPDGFKAFVKACHARGLAVLLDVIHNHYGPSDLEMWNFDGYSGNNSVGGGGIYFYESDTNVQITPWGNTRPNYGSNAVSAFIEDSISMWLGEYHVDGFRWDAPTAILNDNNGNYISAGGALLNAANGIIHNDYTNKISIAEDVYNSFGFDTTWDTSYPYTVTPIIATTPDASRNLSALTNALLDNVRYGGAASSKRVTFLEDHDVIGDLNNGSRLVTSIDSTTPNSYRARKLSLLATALTFTAPGVPMLFQGQEMLENQAFDSSRIVDWTKTNTYSGIVSGYRDLIRLRRNVQGYSAGLKGDQYSFLKMDAANQILVARRRPGGVSGSDAIIVANLLGTAKLNYPVPFPSIGTWYLHYNTDATNYSSDFSNVGSNSVSSSVTGANVNIGPYSVQIYTQQPFGPTLGLSQGNGMVTLNWPLNFAGWVLESAGSLNGSPASWSAVPAVLLQTNGTSVSTSLAPAGTMFYRLRTP